MGLENTTIWDRTVVDFEYLIHRTDLEKTSERNRERL